MGTTIKTARKLSLSLSHTHTKQNNNNKQNKLFRYDYEKAIKLTSGLQLYRSIATDQRSFMLATIHILLIKLSFPKRGLK